MTTLESNRLTLIIKLRIVVDKVRNDKKEVGIGLGMLMKNKEISVYGLNKERV